jgi:hypothetical protein
MACNAPIRYRDTLQVATFRSGVSAHNSFSNKFLKSFFYKTESEHVPIACEGFMARVYRVAIRIKERS